MCEILAMAAWKVRDTVKEWMRSDAEKRKDWSDSTPWGLNQEQIGKIDS